jgi:hypothetical protein
VPDGTLDGSLPEWKHEGDIAEEKHDQDVPASAKGPHGIDEVLGANCPSNRLNAEQVIRSARSWARSRNQLSFLARSSDQRSKYSPAVDRNRNPSASSNDDGGRRRFPARSTASGLRRRQLDFRRRDLVHGQLCAARGIVPVDAVVCLLPPGTALQTAGYNRRGARHSLEGRMGASNAGTLKGKGERGGAPGGHAMDESENLKTPKQGVWWFRVSFGYAAGCVFILLHAWCAPSDPQRGHGQASQPPAGRARSAER